MAVVVVRAVGFLGRMAFTVNPLQVLLPALITSGISLFFLFIYLFKGAIFPARAATGLHATSRARQAYAPGLLRGGCG